MTAQRVEVAPATEEHFPGCPCGACQGVRARRPVVAAMQAKHLSGASIGRLVEYETHRSMETNEHVWSPVAILATVAHRIDETEISATEGDVLWTITIKHDDWVRVTMKDAS